MDKVRFQKIAGLIKEDEDFDLSDNPLNVRNFPTFEEVTNSNTFQFLMDDGDWNYGRFGFGDVRNRCYMVFLEGEASDDNITLLKKGLTVEKVIAEGINRGYFFYDTGGLYFKQDREDRMLDWLYSLEDKKVIKEEDFDLSFNPLNVTKKASYDEIVNSSTFESVMDDGHYNYDRFGFGDVRNRCYLVFLEGDESVEYVILLKEGLTSEKVIEEGIDKGYFFYDTGGLYFKIDREDEMQNWLYSLEDENSINEEQNFDQSENSLTKLERIETRRKPQINTRGAFKIVYDYEHNPDKIIKMFPAHLRGRVKKEYEESLKHPNLFAKVYKVNFDKNFMIQQKLNTEKVKEELDEFGDYYDMLSSEVLDYFENVVRDSKETKEVIDEFNKVNPELGKKVQRWLDFTKKVTELDVDGLVDFNPGNMGYDDKGNLKLLDI